MLELPNRRLSSSSRPDGHRTETTQLTMRSLLVTAGRFVFLFRGNRQWHLF
jgi:hypothetical protein